MKQFWSSLSGASRVGFSVGALLIVVLGLGAAYWVLRPNYQILFSSLAPQDSAAMVAELEKMRIPYRLQGDGTAITVPEDAVPKTRIKLLGKDFPLHGTVGFELFNASDFGMTEFAQKVNYQRALQGEITRTILSLSEVQSVRVHLVLPDDGVFKRQEGRAKASVTLALKQGQALAAEQITGIQRLVSAAAPGISTRDVTIVNQHGVALTKNYSADAERSNSEALDLKKEIEAHLERKAVKVLAESFGPGNAMASVDVALNMELIKTTTEDVLPIENPDGERSGVVVRERENSREGSPVDDGPVSGAKVLAGGTSSREVEYQVGRRIAQVVAQPGSIKRLQVAAVVHKPLDSVELEKIQKLIGTAIGVDPGRGDIVFVHSLIGLAKPHSDSPTSAERAFDPLDESRTDTKEFFAHKRGDSSIGGLGVILLVVVVLLLVFLLWGQRIRSMIRPRLNAVNPTMTDIERQQLLKQIERWLEK